jgi:cellulose synthase/poly-beta-1,6-N-acetylglucosamine synthase-like glycosyltransferase
VPKKVEKSALESESTVIIQLNDSDFQMVHDRKFGRPIAAARDISSKDYVVVIGHFPAFNQEANIRAVVEEAYRTIPKQAPNFEIIVVNNGNKDRTGEICNPLVEQLSNVRVVHHPRNRGYGGALKSGIKLCPT